MIEMNAHKGFEPSLKALTIRDRQWIECNQNEVPENVFRLCFRRSVDGQRTLKLVTFNIAMLALKERNRFERWTQRTATYRAFTVLTCAVLHFRLIKTKPGFLSSELHRATNWWKQISSGTLFGLQKTAATRSGAKLNWCVRCAKKIAWKSRRRKEERREGKGREWKGRERKESKRKQKEEIL